MTHSPTTSSSPNAAKLAAKRIFRQLGWDIRRRPPTPYERLRDEPRFQEKIVPLLGQSFKIADALSFYWSFREIFVDRIYQFHTCRQHPTIIDCGSNCGVSMVYFKSVYPESRIIGIEPDPELFRILTDNVSSRGYEDITLVNKAIAASNREVTFYRQGADGSRTFPLASAKETITVETIPLDDLIDGDVDFLKIDIEGAETEAVLAANKLPNVAQLFIEYHSFRDTRQTLSELLAKLTDEGFRYYIHTQFCSPRPLTEPEERAGIDLLLNIFATRELQ